MNELSRPQPLADHHGLLGFDSGEPSLDDWLIKRARLNQQSGASRTYVVCRGSNVVGYYALATAAVDFDTVPGALRRNMPDPIPAVMIGRLAIARTEQGRGLGRALIRDALQRIASASEQIGISLILVHALSLRAKKFYIDCGFRESPLDELVVLARIKDVQAAID